MDSKIFSSYRWKPHNYQRIPRLAARRSLRSALRFQNENLEDFELSDLAYFKMNNEKWYRVDGIFVDKNKVDKFLRKNIGKNWSDIFSNLCSKAKGEYQRYLISSIDDTVFDSDNRVWNYDEIIFYKYVIQDGILLPKKNSRLEEWQKEIDERLRTKRNLKKCKLQLNVLACGYLNLEECIVHSVEFNEKDYLISAKILYLTKNGWELYTGKAETPEGEEKFYFRRAPIHKSIELRNHYDLPDERWESRNSVERFSFSQGYARANRRKELLKLQKDRNILF